ncbi:MAG: M14 family metallocarboxypeptidase [Nitrospinae bacterium]|nr:M14 family metallocarboxypeptidase [Nitrospinota bacterium]MBL7019038.1 M14 family metallocarboxypeptidase [Nitrospinaceae bacterium]
MNSPLNDIEIIFSRLRKQLPEKNGLLTSYPLETPDKNYSLGKFVLGEGNRRKALISAGIHGDEPGGVETICNFLENNRFERFSDEWELTFLPCINPHGYEYGTRENHEGKDLNRLFRQETPPPEVAFAKSILEKHYELTIELHEDFMSPGYYLYQQGTHQEDDHLGKKILQDVKDIMPINLNGEIDGRSAQAGIMVQESNFMSMDWWPMALYSLFKGARRCLTLETATKFPIDMRVEAHSAAINTALTCFSGEE